MRFQARNVLLALPVVCIIAIGILFSSCNGYQKLLKSSDVNYKLTKANEYFNNKDYAKAQELYESLMPVMKNTRNYEPLYYRYAYTYYYMKEYLIASFQFKNFAEAFPNSPDAEECEYMHGYCLYKDAPNFTLDQTNTVKSMEALQSFVNTHPKSKYAVQANDVIFDCHNKLESKDADAARLYYNLGPYRPDCYKAAYVAYKSVMHNYPESTNMDLYQSMTVKALYYYAKESIPEKQEERFASAMGAYQELLSSYPNSKYLQDAGKFNTLADNNIKKIRNNEHK
jgi:outer membrane protein assembly factor BamD